MANPFGRHRPRRAFPLELVSEEVIELTARQMVEEREMAAAVHLAAMIRRLDRENPGYDA